MRVQYWIERVVVWVFGIILTAAFLLFFGLPPLGTVLIGFAGAVIIETFKAKRG